MNGWSARFYDTFLSPTESAGLRAWRRALLSATRGPTLEIGAGTGLNLPLYPSPGPSHLTLSEPSDAMRAQLSAKLSAQPPPFATTLRSHGAERIPDPDDSYETVVCTLVLCTVPDPAAVLAEVRRVLRPTGRLLFIEHVAAAGAWRTGQRLLEPVWRPLAGGCCLTRETLPAISAAGFEVVDVSHDHLPRAPGFLRTSIRGTARPRGKGGARGV